MKQKLLSSFRLRVVMLVAILCSAFTGTVWGENITASFAPSDFSGQGTSGTGSAISATVDGVTFACNKGYGTTQIRCYSGGKITISSSNTITAISFTFSGSYTGGLETSYTDLSTNSWENTLSSQARITACSVTYSSGGGDTPTPTTYTVSFDAGAGTFVGNMDFPNASNNGLTSGEYTLPTATPPAGYNFDGWVATGLDTPVTGSYNVTADVAFTASYSDANSHTYNFAGANNFYTDSNLTNHPSSGSSSNVETIYYSDGKTFVASGASRYFSSASSGYFMLGKSGAQINLPTFSGYKITQVKIHSSSGHSTKVAVSIVSGSNTASAEQTWSAQNADYTYNIASDYQNAELSIKVTNAYNSQFTSITIVCVPFTDPVINATNPEALAYNATSGEFGYSITNPATDVYLSATSNADWITNVAVDGTNSKVTFNTSTNTGAQRQGTITLSYTGAPDKVITITQAGAPAPSISANDVEIAYNDNSGEISYTLANSAANGSFSVSEEVAWISNATLNTQENKVTFTCETNEGVVARTGTVTITYTYNTNQTVSKEVTVTQGVDETLGTAANPYTVAQARAYIDGLNGSTSADGKHVSGIISQVDSYNSNYSSITYWISDDGTTTNQLEVYSGKGIDGEDFSAVTDVAVGAEVVVKGKLKYFSSQSVYEFDYNNELVSYTAPSVNTPSITAENVNIASDETGSSIVYTLNNEVQDGEVTADITAGNTGNWLSIGNPSNSNASGSVPLTCSTNDGAERTATVTLTYTYNSNETVTKDVTVTQAAYVAPLPTPTNDNYIRISNLNQLTDGSIVVIAARYDDNDNKYYAMANTTSGKPSGTSFTSSTANGLEILPLDIVNNEGDYYWVVNVTTNGYTFTKVGGDMIGYSSSTNFAANGNTEWTIAKETSENTAMVAGYSGFVIKNKNTDTRGFAFNGSAFGAYATSNMNASGYNFYLDFFVQKATGTITLNSACNDNGVIYGTFYTDRPYVMPENLDGSVVKVGADGKLDVRAVYEGTNGDVVPANTALLINSHDTFTGTKDYTIFYTNESGVGHSSDNMLKGTLTANDMTEGDNCLFYRLTMHGANPSNNEPGTIGFWWGASDGGVFKPGANKAYLAVPKATAARISGFAFDEDGTTTAIEDVRVADGKNAVYNLNGQRVNNPAKGMYIVNGKKVIK